MSEIESIRAVLDYNPNTGLLTWLTGGRGRTGGVGAEAGTQSGNGYRRIMVCGKNYLSHRLAWALTHGSWPDGCIDHINGVRDDNRISNLRDVSVSENMQNQKRAQSNNMSGSSVPGVSWSKSRGMFLAQAKRGGKLVHVGFFKTLPEAERAALTYRREHYKGNTL